MIAVQAADPVAFERDAHPFLKKYCNSCHNKDKKEGELDLARFDKPQEVLATLPKWETVAKRIRDKEMPPEGSPQPGEEEFLRFLSWYGTLPKPEKDCQNLATDATQNFYQGYVMSRRLTRLEYGHAVRDLFGYETHAEDFVPADGSGGEGFDTNGSSLFTSAILTEKYIQAANAIVDRLLPDQQPSSGAEHEAWQKIIFVQPNEQLPPREAATQIAERLAYHAYRRPVQPEDVDRLLKLFDGAQSRGEGFVASIRLLVKGVLISPHFLFLPEPEPAEEGVHPLDSYPLAARLSFFLWSSGPDEELLELARQNRLQEDEVLKGQVHRMLHDPRAKALGENFSLQWLGLTNFGANRPDSRKFPEFDDATVAAMRAETVAFCAAILTEDRPLLDMINANYTFVNGRLAKVYGLVGIEGDEFRRVDVPDGKRGGVVTQGAVLVSTSFPLRTSPVLRGRWVLEELLGSKVPPPPPNVPALKEDEHSAAEQTLRERLELHRKDPNCASCHNRMDPLGFGLENFDAMGRWRNDDSGKPVDASGALPSGEKFSGPAELKKVLMVKRHDFVRNFVRKMLGYALGRGLNKFDDCVVKDTIKALEQNEYRTSVMFEQIVMSYPFRHRYTKK